MDKKKSEQTGKWPQPQPTLEAARLVLRPFALSDARELQRLAGDFSIADTTINVAHPYPDGLAETWISTHESLYQREEAVSFALLRKEDGGLIGAVGLKATQRFCRAELGYWITQSQWNQGYATEAAGAVVDFGFARLGLHKIEATHFRRNPASGKVMRKLGFEQEGVLRDHIIKWERFEDLVTYGLIR